jgi:hypothetical protein
MKTSLRSLAILTLALTGLALLPKTEAVSPAPDGGYPGGNTAEGQNALLGLTTGTYNTAVGFFSLGGNTFGQFNTGLGAGTLFSNTFGASNTATGAGALLSNTDGIVNTANGAFALVSNTEGQFNTAIGANALFANTGGSFNTAVGREALDSNITGNGNVALGNFAGFGVIAANNVICIGNGVTGVDVDNTCFIGNIRDVTTQNGDAIPVVIDSAGQLGTASSSAKFKKDIQPMDKASQALLALNPVTFHYKSDQRGTPQFGLIAEEVAKVNPDLVVRDKNGEIYTVRYDAVNAMLLNEFLKEHRKVEQQDRKIREEETTITQLKTEMETVVARLKEHDSKIERVSDQLQRSQTEAKLVQNR